MDPDGDIVMDDVPLYNEVPQSLIQSSTADFTLTFGKFQGRTLLQVPPWYLQWLHSNITDPSPAFRDALNHAMSESRFANMEIDWKLPNLANADDKFFLSYKLRGGGKSEHTALWITRIDTMKFFSLSDEILRVMGVPELPGNRSSQERFPNITKYALYYIWDLAQVYMTEEEANFALEKYSEKVRESFRK